MKCGFCGGPQQCRMHKCKAYNVKCNNCNLFGHIKNCCMDFTKSRARKDRDKTTVSKVEDDTVEEANGVHLHHVRRKEEKKLRQKERKARDRMDANKAIINEPKKADVISEDVNNSEVINNEVKNDQVIRLHHVATMN